MIDADPRKRLDAAYAEAGSYRALAARLNFSAAFLCAVRNGDRPFSPALLKALGLRRREVYVPIGVDDR
jgi:hypothetical protein